MSLLGRRAGALQLGRRPCSSPPSCSSSPSTSPKSPAGSSCPCACIAAASALSLGPARGNFERFMPVRAISPSSSSLMMLPSTPLRLGRRRGLWTLTTAAALAVSCVSTASAAIGCDSSPAAMKVSTAAGNQQPVTPQEPADSRQVKGGAPPLFTSVQASRGHRSYMEDEFFLSDDGRFAAVYDGHGGAAVSKYLRQNLFQKVQAHLPADGPPDDGEAVMTALKSAFRDVDEEVLAVSHWSYMGSTAVAVVVHQGPGGGHIITANVGDSRAVLGRGGKAIDLTKDHKPNCPTELERIEKLGGNVRWYGFFDPEGRPIEGTGVYRINGNLAVARAIGDGTERPFVSGSADIRAFPMDPEGDQFIILATDGLWDVMSSDEAVTFVHSVMGGAMGALREGGGTTTITAGDRPVDMKLSDWTRRYTNDRGMIRAALVRRKKKMARYLTDEAIRRGTMDNEKHEDYYMILAEQTKGMEAI